MRKTTWLRSVCDTFWWRIWRTTRANQALVNVISCNTQQWIGPNTYKRWAWSWTTKYSTEYIECAIWAENGLYCGFLFFGGQWCYTDRCHQWMHSIWQHLTAMGKNFIIYFLLRNTISIRQMTQKQLHLFRLRKTDTTRSCRCWLETELIHLQSIAPLSKDSKDHEASEYTVQSNVIILPLFTSLGTSATVLWFSLAVLIARNRTWTHMRFGMMRPWDLRLLVIKMNENLLHIFVYSFQSLHTMWLIICELRRGFLQPP